MQKKVCRGMEVLNPGLAETRYRVGGEVDRGGRSPDQIGNEPPRRRGLGETEMPMAKSIEDLRLPRRCSYYRQAVRCRRAVTCPVRSAPYLQARQVPRCKRHQCLATLEVWFGVKTSEFRGTTNPQPTAQRRRHELPFCED